MKKIFKWITLVVTVCMSLVIMVGCASLSSGAGNGGNNSENSSREVMLTLYNGEESSESEVKLFQFAQIETPTKKGYYLDGYYDAKEGGEKYFDTTGKSLVKWEKSFPTTLYAQWKDIMLLQHEEQVLNNTPKMCDPWSEIENELQLDSTFISGLKGNFNRKLKIEYSVDLKLSNEDCPIDMYVAGYSTEGADKHVLLTYETESNNPLSTETFRTYTGIVEVPANDFVEGNIYLVIYCPEARGWFPDYYARNLTLKVSFAPEVAEDMSDAN